ncbi:MAG: class I SAM-dependent methyltransferase [Nitrospirota bacterium]
MPVDAGVSSDGIVFQREQYNKGGLSRKYWDYRDESIISAIGGGGRILDAGCGEGILLEKLVKRFPDREVMGLDIDPINIKICGEHGLPVRQGGLYGLPFGDESFDVCLFIEVIEHLDRPHEALAELNRVLRKGGRLLILFPNDLTFKIARVMMLMFKEAFYDTGHLRQWTPGAMKRALAENGFRVVTKKSMPLPFFPISLHHLTVAEKDF